MNECTVDEENEKMTVEMGEKWETEKGTFFTITTGALQPSTEQVFYETTLPWPLCRGYSSQPRTDPTTSWRLAEPYGCVDNTGQTEDY